MSDEVTNETVTTDDTNTEGATPEATEELGENGRKALNAEREARKAAEKATAELARRLKEIEDKDKTEAERTAERLAAAEKRAAELELKAIKAEVAAAKGVPAALLTGSTQDELEAAADALIAFRGEKVAPTSPALGRVNIHKSPSTPAERFAASLDGLL